MKRSTCPYKGQKVDFDINSQGKALKVYIVVQNEFISKQNITPVMAEAYEKQLEVEKQYGIFSWLKKSMKNYVNFQGRARRSDFFGFVYITF